MTASNVFFIVATVVVSVVGVYLTLALAQMRKTLGKMDETLTDVQEVLDHAERVVAMTEAPVRAVTNAVMDVQRGTRTISHAIDRFGLGVVKPLERTASVLGVVMDTLGITHKRKGGNNDF